jgi:hypothetical protein
VAYFNVLSKCDQALAAWIISNGAGTVADVLPAKKSVDKILPVTICKSHTARPLEESPYSGNRLVQAAIMVRSIGIYEEDADNEADAPRLDSDARVSATFDCFNLGEGQSGSDLGAAITAACGVADFTVQSVRVVSESAGFEGKGDAWCDILELELLVCPSALG